MNRREVSVLATLWVATLFSPAFGQQVGAPSLRIEMVRPEGKSARKGAIYLAMQTRTPVRVDGDLSEWRDITPIALHDTSHVYTTPGTTWQGPDDLSAKAYLMWDAQNLYFACDVRDDTYSQSYIGKDIWRGDCVQLGFDTLRDASRAARQSEAGWYDHGHNVHYDVNDYEYGLALTGTGPVAWRWYAGARDFSNVDASTEVNLSVAMKGDKRGYIYEVAIPWLRLEPLLPLAMTSCGFSFTVNDRDDGDKDGERVALEWTPGILQIGKDPTKFGELIFMATSPLDKRWEVFLQTTQMSLFDDDEARVVVAFNTSESCTLTLSASMEHEDREIARITKDFHFSYGVHRALLLWNAERWPRGEYVLCMEVYDEAKKSVEKKRFSWFKYTRLE